MDLQTGFKYALKNERLVHGALKKAGATYFHRDYEDLLHEGLITFANMFCELGEDHPNLHLQVFQRITWQTIDFLRRESRINEKNEILENYDFSLFYENEDRDFWLMIQEISQNFNYLERLVFQEHLLNGVTLTQLARENPVSLRQLHRVKTSVVTSLRNLTK